MESNNNMVNTSLPGGAMVPAALPGAVQDVPVVPTLDRRVKVLRLAAITCVLALFYVLIPILNSTGVVTDLSVNILSRYLCFAIVALGVDLVWGYAGLLSLCQAFFFCLGGYAMGMFLSLPQGGGQVAKAYNNIPQFFFFNNRATLPEFWKPFASLPFALAAGIVIPAALAGLFGFFIFRSRVRGVYFAIITQALAWAAYLLFCRNELLLGGTDGLNNFYPPLQHSHRWILGLYFLTAVVLGVTYVLLFQLTKSRFGRILIAIRDKELRLNFAGYKPYAFKVLAFVIGAVVAAVGGILYVPQNGIITPGTMAVESSILMVVLVAVGGRGRLWGAIIGALIVRYAYSILSSDMPAIWSFFEGGLFIAVTLLFSNGLVGLWDEIEHKIASRQGAIQVSLAVIPFLTVMGFVLVEALDVMPAMLQRSVQTPWSVMPDIPIKFIVLVAILALVALARWYVRFTQDPRRKSVAPVPAASIAAEEAHA
jgi:urea transport system permease protein